MRQFFEKYDPTRVETKADESLNIPALRKRLNDKLELLTGIERLKERKQCAIESIEGFIGTFPKLRDESYDDVSILNMKINELTELYKNM